MTPALLSAVVFVLILAVFVAGILVGVRRERRAHTAAIDLAFGGYREGER